MSAGIEGDVPVLGKDERGAIILPYDLRQSHIISKGGVDLQTIRTALFFFDKFVHPNNNFLHQAHEDKTGLEGLEILSAPKVRFGDMQVRDQLQPAGYAMIEMLELLNQREPGRWSLFRSEDTAPIPESELSPYAAAMIKLREALPVPDREVPLEDILIFKDYRKAELLALRDFLEDVAAILSSEEAVSLNAVRAAERFDRALADYKRVVGESNWRKSLSSLEIGFSFKDAALAAGSAWSTGAGGIAALGSGLLAGAGLGLSFSRSRPILSGPFTYLAQIEADLM